MKPKRPWTGIEIDLSPTNTELYACRSGLLTDTEPTPENAADRVWVVYRNTREIIRKAPNTLVKNWLTLSGTADPPVVMGVLMGAISCNVSSIRWKPTADPLPEKHTGNHVCGINIDPQGLYYEALKVKNRLIANRRRREKRKAERAAKKAAE